MTSRTCLLIAAVFAASACEREGMTTREVQAAAIAETRQQLGIASDVPLKASVWVGNQELDGEMSYCGTVSSKSGSSQPDSAMKPMRFLATGDPPQWRVFEDAHNPMAVTKRADKVVDWARYCAAGR